MGWGGGSGFLSELITVGKLHAAHAIKGFFRMQPTFIHSQTDNREYPAIPQDRFICISSSFRLRLCSRINFQSSVTFDADTAQVGEFHQEFGEAVRLTRTPFPNVMLQGFEHRFL